MLGILSRSRSLRGGGGYAGDSSKTHGPNAPVSNEPGLVSGPTLQNSTVLGLVENADIPSSKFPDGRNQYLNRPLPPPPPPKDSATMPARPSTSGGGNAVKGFSKTSMDKRISRDDMFLTSKSRRPDFDKRMSRDDMFVGTRASQGFHVPMRGLPTPDASPRYYAPPFAPVPARLATPESIASGEIPIGMALGSPGHPPEPAAAWQPQTFAPSQLSSTPEPPAIGEPTLQRTKTGRRKLFGFFGGGKKHQGPAQQVNVSSGSPSPMMTSAIAAPQISVEPPPVRSNTVAERKTPRYQPIVTRTNTEPFPSSPKPAKESRPLMPFLRSKSSEPAIRQQNENSSSQDTLRPPLPTSASPYLNVEIPSIKMERYSVMFGSLLHPPHHQQSSSLLARRQATLDKLKTINDKIVQEEEQAKGMSKQRRATSPQPTKSPAFTLFPPTPSKKHDSPGTTPQRLSPRTRSNTSPAMLPSPVKTTFDHDPLRANRGRGNFLKVNPLRENPTMIREAQKTPRVIHFDPAQSNLILDSPTSMEDTFEPSKLTEPFQPHIPEPQWQMISPSSSAAPSTVSSSASSTRKRSPSSVSSVQTHYTKPSIDEADAVLKSAVEISIARQISISRQQRQLLRPLQTNVPPVGSSPRASPARATPVKKLGRNEKLHETKSATPTLVRPEQSLESHLMQHRKSERIVLEAV